MHFGLRSEQPRYASAPRPIPVRETLTAACPNCFHPLPLSCPDTCSSMYPGIFSILHHDSGRAPSTWSTTHFPRHPRRDSRALGFSVAVFLLRTPLRRRLSPVFRPTLRPSRDRLSDRHPPKQPGQPTWPRTLFSAFLMRRRFRTFPSSLGTHLRTPLPGLSAPGGRSLHSNPPLPPRCTAQPSANTNKPSGAQPPPRRILRFVPFISHNVLAINFVPAKFVGGGILLPLSHRKA